MNNVTRYVKVINTFTQQARQTTFLCEYWEVSKLSKS